MVEDAKHLVDNIDEGFVKDITSAGMLNGIQIYRLLNQMASGTQQVGMNLCSAIAFFSLVGGTVKDVDEMARDTANIIRSLMLLYQESPSLRRPLLEEELKIINLPIAEDNFTPEGLSQYKIKLAERRTELEREIAELNEKEDYRPDRSLDQLTILR